jgi:hypothetical protein
MRRVIYFEYEKLNEDTFVTKVEKGHGYFHAWGLEYEEFELGIGEFKLIDRSKK